LRKTPQSPYRPTRLLVSSWDRNVYLYDTHAEPGGKLLQKFEHRSPVLDVCFGRDDNEAFTCGLDWEVRRSVILRRFKAGHEQAG
jgi:cell cycle arrest protein BUB3